MEKIMTVEEKIRKAEEISNRRNGKSYTYQNTQIQRKRAPSLINKMLKQIIICLLIYGVFYTITNKEYFLSQEFQNKIEETASKNEQTKKAYNWLMQYIQKYINQTTEQNESTTNEQNAEPQSENNNTINSENENIGGATEQEIDKEQSQEEKDIEKIKSTIKFIKPIEGTISSTFGYRNPTTATVPKYHTGLDIAANTGTIIKSATDGEVILASSEGDYGNHYKIQIEDVTIIYAHCSKLYLNKGEKVFIGQEIGEVGSTGNSTRTTFAF